MNGACEIQHYSQETLKPLTTNQKKWEGNTKANLRKIGFGGVDSVQMSSSRYGPVSSFHEHGVEPMGSVRARALLTG